MPFANYKSFRDCTNKNKDKDDPEAYCATIMREVEGSAIGYGFDKCCPILSGKDGAAASTEIMQKLEKSMMEKAKLEKEKAEMEISGYKGWCSDCSHGMLYNESRGIYVCPKCGDIQEAAKETSQSNVVYDRIAKRLFGEDFDRLTEQEKEEVRKEFWKQAKEAKATKEPTRAEIASMIKEKATKSLEEMWADRENDDDFKIQARWAGYPEKDIANFLMGGKTKATKETSVSSRDKSNINIALDRLAKKKFSRDYDQLSRNERDEIILDAAFEEESTKEASSKHLFDVTETPKPKVKKLSPKALEAKARAEAKRKSKVIPTKLNTASKEKSQEDEDAPHEYTMKRKLSTMAKAACSRQRGRPSVAARIREKSDVHPYDVVYRRIKKEKADWRPIKKEPSKSMGLAPKKEEKPKGTQKTLTESAKTAIGRKRQKLTLLARH